MTRKILYRNIASLCAIFLTAIFLFTFFSSSHPSWLDLVFDLLAIALFSFTFLWIEKYILFIGLTLYLIDFNIILKLGLYSSDTMSKIPADYSALGLTLSLLSYACLLLGLEKRFTIKYLSTTSNSPLLLIAGVIVATILVQYFI